MLHGFPPTIREIGEGVGIKSPSAVQFHLKHLCDKGLIEVNEKEARAIKVVGYIFVKEYNLPMI